MRTAIPVLGVWSKAKLALTVSLILMAGLMRVNATELQCIEESKYKYLYQLFDGDMRRFADYFGLDPDVRRLPDPEFCRAALLSGPTGEPSKDEFGDLIRIIVRNRG